MTQRWIQEIRINKNGLSAEQLTVDGEPFPFYVVGDPLRIEVNPRTGISTVYLGLMADRVVIEGLPSIPVERAS